MASNEDFKQAIRSGNISEAFLVAMSNAPELNITTKIITAEGDRADAAQSEIDNYLHTHINLIEGKVENEIGEKLTGDRYSEIKQFHIEQVTQGHQTIQHNLISLQKMFQLMSSFQQQQASSHPSWVDIAADVTSESLTTKSNSNQLYGDKVPNVLEAGTSDLSHTNPPEQDELDRNHEAQLPSFEENELEDEIVDDLLSLTDLDDSSESSSANEADWSEWLDDEPEVKTKVFDLKSLNTQEGQEDWQDWEAQNDAVTDNLPES